MLVTQSCLILCDHIDCSHSLLPRDLPDPVIKPGSLVFQADSLPSGPKWKPNNPYKIFYFPSF